MRTETIPEDIYEFIIQRTEKENRTFRSYVCELVERDRRQQILLGDEIRQLQRTIESTIKRENDQLLRQINERLLNVSSIHSEITEDAKEKNDYTKEEKLLDINAEVRGELNESDYDTDF